MKPASQEQRRIKVLLVEDDESDAYLVQGKLDKECPGEFDIVRSVSVEKALPFLKSQPFDIALLDLSLPGMSELEALKSLQYAAPRLPVVILTGFGDEALSVAAMQSGAQDYLLKEQADGQAVKRAIRYAVDRKHFEDALTTLANYDTLTGLTNRNLFENRLELALARAKRSGHLLAVLFLDLDRFKHVNDTLGHEVGDKVLREVAERLKHSLREVDTIARFGGDEFAILIEDLSQTKDCQVVAEKVIASLIKPLEIAGKPVDLGVSIGIALSTPGCTMAELLRHADAAMYGAKSENGSNFKFYSGDMRRQADGKIQLARELQEAVKKKDRLCLYYQPKLDIASGMLAGAEALLRWDHPVRGMLTPNEFMPLIEGEKLQEELDSWILETVCRDIKCWLAAGLRPTQISIHVSSKQWSDSGMMNGLIEILQKAGIDPAYFAVEVEESAVLQKTGGEFDRLTRIREMGVEVHLDNFGADISSLKLLTRCPLDAIKIDRQLTGELNRAESHAALVKALIDLGHNLGMKVVAEGVETREQQKTLADMQCDQIQGIVVSKPLPADEFFSWMGTRQKAAS